MVLLLALVVGPSFASPSLRASGICPGPTTVDVDGVTPGAGFVVLRSDAAGSSVVPAGPCAGVPLGLMDGAPPNDLRTHGTFTADAWGSHEFALALAPAGCAARLQVVDLATCAPSNVARVSPPHACAPGSLLAQRTLPGGVVSADAITTTTSWIVVSVTDPAAGNLLVYLDPVTLTVVAAEAAGIKAGEPGLSYDPVHDAVWHYATTYPTGEVVLYPAASNVWLHKWRPGAPNHVGAVDPVHGALSLPLDAGGVAVWSDAGAQIGSILPGLVARDLEFEGQARYLYALDATSAEVERYDLRSGTPTLVDAWPNEGAAQPFVPWDLGVDRDQRVFSVDPAGDRVVLWDRFGRELAVIPLPPGSTPRAVHPMAQDGSVLIATESGGAGVLWKLCGP
ncbi:MAG TPA: hypothetical protein PKA64_16875 [Myxococcota bacterium]|nr:hypothetical protein [Myxococcota bacterium]